MARTNKMGILKKKQQQAKQKSLTGEKVSSNEGIKQNHTNPLGHDWPWFMRSGKWVCDVTSIREDPDGFRIRRAPSGGELTFIQIGDASRWFRQWLRKKRKQ